MQSLDLKNIPCPINFVRTKLALETLQLGEVLKVTLDDGEPIESVASSITQEGHEILEKIQNEDSSWNLEIKKSV